MTATTEFITALFCQVDDHLAGLPKHPEAHLWPSEVVTLGLLHALKGVGNRPFYRWLTRDYRPLFPRLPERTRLFRLLKTHHDWTQVFLAAPTVLGVIDTYGIELIHPMREGRSPQQIGRKGLSNHRWIVGGELCLLLNQWGLIVGWACGTANAADNTFQWLIQQVDGRMIVLSDTGFHAAEGDPSNLKLCPRGEWQDRMLVETVLSMLTLVCHLKKVMHRGWAYFQARLAFTMAAFNVLVQWHGFQPTASGFLPSRWLSLVCKLPILWLGLSETNTIGYIVDNDEGTAQCVPASLFQGFANSVHPLNRQTGDPRHKASLSVEQPMPPICARLAPRPQVVRHPALSGLLRRLTPPCQLLDEPGGLTLPCSGGVVAEV